MGQTAMSSEEKLRNEAAELKGRAKAVLDHGGDDPGSDRTEIAAAIYRLGSVVAEVGVGIIKALYYAVGQQR